MNKPMRKLVPFKKIYQNRLSQWFFGFLIAVVALFIRLTCRVKVENKQAAGKYWRKKQPVIITLWHGRLLMMPFVFPWRNRKVSALISAHRDGRLVSCTAALFGIKTVTGSTGKQGVRALRQMVKRAHAGHTLFITPDGPRGPFMRVSKGTVEIARLSELPIIPVTITASKGRIFKSWDRFMIPRPFSKIVIRFGDELFIDENTAPEKREEFRKQLEGDMIALQWSADRAIGQNIVLTPAPYMDENDTMPDVASIIDDETMQKFKRG